MRLGVGVMTVSYCYQLPLHSRWTSRGSFAATWRSACPEGLAEAADPVLLTSTISPPVLLQGIGCR